LLLLEPLPPHAAARATAPMAATVPRERNPERNRDRARSLIVVELPS
jgi:hypothetical protein